jgi:hypothetical protein
MTSDRKWRAWLGTLGASLIITVVAIPFVGNALPEPYGSFVPMLEGHDFVRDEFVRQHALTETPEPCVALLGDSRTAFNISGAVIDRFLPSECRAQNYGFASLRLPQIRQLISDIPARTDAIVISVSETMLYPSTHDTAIEAILATSWIRHFYLGYHRLKHLYAPKPDSGWSWSPKEKRWLFRLLEKRMFIDSPSYENEAASMAASYFATLRLDHVDELKSFLAWAKARTKRLIVVLPPSDVRFQTASEHFGNQHRYWHMIANAAHDAGADLIDCSRSCVEPTGFADPVHLNAQGTAAYSANLGRRLLALSLASQQTPP